MLESAIPVTGNQSHRKNMAQSSTRILSEYTNLVGNQPGIACAASAFVAGSALHTDLRLVNPVKTTRPERKSHRMTAVMLTVRIAAVSVSLNRSEGCIKPPGQCLSVSAVNGKSA